MVSYIFTHMVIFHVAKTNTRKLYYVFLTTSQVNLILLSLLKNPQITSLLTSKLIDHVQTINILRSILPLIFQIFTGLCLFTCTIIQKIACYRHQTNCLTKIAKSKANILDQVDLQSQNFFKNMCSCLGTRTQKIQISAIKNYLTFHNVIH